MKGSALQQMQLCPSNDPFAAFAQYSTSPHVSAHQAQRCLLLDRDISLPVRWELLSGIRSGSRAATSGSPIGGSRQHAMISPNIISSICLVSSPDVSSMAVSGPLTIHDASRAKKNNSDLGILLKLKVITLSSSLLTPGMLPPSLLNCQPRQNA